MVSDVYQVPLKRSIQPARSSDVAGEPALSWPFTVGPENLLVEQAIQQWTSLDCDHTRFKHFANPIVFCGESGLGKSHLALGLAEIWFESNRNCLEKGLVISAPDWVRAIREVITENSLARWRDKCRNFKMLVMDDVHLLRRYHYAQQHLLVLLDDLVGQRIPIIITSSGDPIHQSGLLPGLASRLASGLTVHLKQPGLAARQVFARELVDRHGWLFTESATNRVAEEVSGSTPQLAAALARCATVLGAAQQTVNESQVHQYFVHNPLGQLTIRQIAKCVARYYQLPLSLLVGPSRRKSVVLARALAIYFSRRLTPATLAAIGQCFGGRDHSTILHSLNRIEAQLTDEPGLRIKVAELDRILTNYRDL